MQHDIIGRCPVCDNDTDVTRIRCNSCGTTIEGLFSPCKFCRLTSDQKTFIEVFIKCRGNIKEVEREMGISYPTVKNKLEDAAAALGYKEDAEQDDDGRRKKEILDRLNNGEISAEEAVRMLRD